MQARCSATRPRREAASRQVRTVILVLSRVAIVVPAVQLIYRMPGSSMVDNLIGVNGESSRVGVYTNVVLTDD